MPSFTFAATAHAALWAGLTPLFCDIDPLTWASSSDSEEELLRQYEGELAVVVAYATFGNNIDLDRYRRLSRRHGVPFIVDGAASLGSIDIDGRNFGAGCQSPVVFSMHATKTFATAEGGVVYCDDASAAERLRSMGNFGFEEPGLATMPGLNAKLSEVTALLALEKLKHLPHIVAHRAFLAEAYRSELRDFTFQVIRGGPAYQFMSVLVPSTAAGRRDMVVQVLRENGIGSARYFSPHLAQHPYFRAVGTAGDLSVTDEVAARIISLPLSDGMTADHVVEVCDVLRRAL
jgi:dTDP-4-amino-4,6-dideoxygalactose transaminase